MDGVGATLKVRARRLVLANRATIRNATEFVNAVTEMSINCHLMTCAEIERRNNALNYPLFLKAKTIKDITKNFFISFADDTPKTFLTYKQSS